mmetsp:Transcript_13574/g.15982  ORF Transcript_13574/g.15982 Transcript_13574/m.15982 type:complete len:243 (-) Transcript_13574:781-1509(-)
MYNSHCMIKMLPIDDNTIKNLFIHLVLIKINKPHLSPNTLQRRFHTKLLNIRSHIPMCPTGQNIQIHILSKSHIPRLNLQNLQAPMLIRNPHIHFAIKTTRSPQRRLNHLWPISSRHNNHLRSRLQPIHKRQQLGHNPFLNLTPCLLPLRCNRIQLVNKDNRPTIILRIRRRILKRTPQISLTLPRLLRNNLRPINDKEISPRLRRNRPRHRCLTTSTRTSQQNPSGRIDPQLLPQLRMTQR